MEFKEVSSDKRRTIWANNKLLENNKEISIIKLNPGQIIGGCIHQNVEFICVLEGKMDLLLGNEAKWETLYPGKASKVIYPFTAHTFYTKKGCIVMEWGITAEEKKDQNKDKSHLEIIKALSKC